MAHLHWRGWTWARIGGSKGGARAAPPRGSKFFHFHAVFGTFGSGENPGSTTGTDSDSDSKPDGYIVLCRTCSQCTDSDLDPNSLFPCRTGIRVWVRTPVRLCQCKLAIMSICEEKVMASLWNNIEKSSLFIYIFSISVLCKYNFQSFLLRNRTNVVKEFLLTTTTMYLGQLWRRQLPRYQTIEQRHLLQILTSPKVVITVICHLL